MRRLLPTLSLVVILSAACDNAALPTGIEPYDGPTAWSVGRIPIEETVIVESACLAEPLELRLRQQLVVGGPSMLAAASIPTWWSTTGARRASAW